MLSVYYDMKDSESLEKPSSSINSEDKPQMQSLHEQEDEANTVDSEEEDERRGIIPEGMDFRKFIGCGG